MELQLEPGVEAEMMEPEVDLYVMELQLELEVDLGMQLEVGLLMDSSPYRGPWCF